MKPEPLTESERKIVSLALEAGRLAESGLPAALAQMREGTKSDLVALRTLWASMGEDSRKAIIGTLARRTGLEDRSGLDLGDAVDDFLGSVRGSRGRDVPGLHTVAGTLREVWISRGNDGALRNLHRDRQPKRDARRAVGYEIAAAGPSDMIVFVAKHLIEIFGAEAICRSSDPANLRPENVFRDACTRADTALRSS